MFTRVESQSKHTREIPNGKLALQGEVYRSNDATHAIYVKVAMQRLSRKVRKKSGVLSSATENRQCSHYCTRTLDPTSTGSVGLIRDPSGSTISTSCTGLCSAMHPAVHTCRVWLRTRKTPCACVNVASNRVHDKPGARSHELHCMHACKHDHSKP